MEVMMAELGKVIVTHNTENFTLYKREGKPLCPYVYLFLFLPLPLFLLLYLLLLLSPSPSLYPFPKHTQHLSLIHI